jgi:type VI protein secretion system component Hcp
VEEDEDLDYFLVIDDVDGGSNREEWVGAFEVDAYSLSIEAITSGGGGSGRVEFSPFEVELDLASNADLIQLIAEGTIIESVRFAGVNAGGEENDFVAYHLGLGEVQLVGYDDNEGADRLTFEFGQIELITRELDATGDVVNSSRFAWDLTTSSTIPRDSDEAPSGPALDEGVGLIISEIIEGSGRNRAIEICNVADGPLDLSQFDLEIYHDGATDPSRVLSMAGMLAEGETFVLAHRRADEALLSAADATAGGMSWNGDDAIVLREAATGAVVDGFGQVGTDPGREWDGGGVNETLRRDPDVASGDTDPLDGFDAALEWETFARDDFSGLGAHAIATELI